jgi:exopolyphosphatase / guanosine-5'-triphosphate,3'-diphosphate pyrophosphatase
VDCPGGGQGGGEVTVASIDIGTNTVLLLIARIDGRGEFTPLVHEQRIPRLGRDVDRARNLNPGAMARVLDVLAEYRGIVDEHAPDRTIVCATSAVRDAANRDEFLRLAKAATGFAVEVLTGEEEALWTFRGALSGMPEIVRATVVDIGGGSTEITVGDRTTLEEYVSLDIGAVRIAERCFHHDPPTHPELEQAIEIVENALARAERFPFSGSTLVGVAGTATSLAALDQRLPRFDVRAVTGYRLGLDNVYALFRMLRSMKVAEIQDLSAVMEGRADVMSAGVLILRAIMAHFKFPVMVVSERGVRYGLALRAWEQHVS